MADVARVLPAGPANRVRERIGRALRLPDARAEPDRAQHATAVGQHLAGLHPGAGVKDLARQAGGSLQTLDGVALVHLVRVAGRGQNYAERRARILGWMPSLMMRVCSLGVTAGAGE